MSVRCLGEKSQGRIEMNLGDLVLERIRTANLAYLNLSEQLTKQGVHPLEDYLAARLDVSFSREALIATGVDPEDLLKLESDWDRLANESNTRVRRRHGET